VFSVALGPPHLQKRGSSRTALNLTLLMDSVARGEVCAGILRISPVTIIPPLLHTHSFIYHRRCILLAINSVVKQHIEQISTYEFCNKIYQQALFLPKTYDNEFAIKQCNSPLETQLDCLVSPFKCSRFSILMTVELFDAYHSVPQFTNW
jgi:hypothetical protein